MTFTVDAFLYFQEREALDLRLRELAGVDFHLIVESRWTFQGTPHEPQFERDLLSLNLPPDMIEQRLLYVVIEDPVETDDPWLRETVQRNTMGDALSKLSLPDDAIILLSDVDEIPCADSMPRSLAPGETYRLCQGHYQYFLNLCKGEPHWHGTRVIRADDLRRTTPQALRGHGVGMVHRPEDRPGGWHFSFLGDGAALERKLAAWSHGPVEGATAGYFDAARRDILGWQRSGVDWDLQPLPLLSVVPFGDWLPACVRAHPERYSLLVGETA